jgi:hypothetical protein
MFATVIVVLPSEFTGGDAHVSHGGETKVFDTSALSLSKTTVLAWYTDVMHEIVSLTCRSSGVATLTATQKPITAGYRLALSYNLLHTTKAVRPALSEPSETVSLLRQLLLSWSTAKHDEVPDKIIYMLEHKYSQANLSASALKSRDAHLLAILDRIATEIGFCLGLANVHHTESGPGDDSGGYYGGGMRVDMESVEDTRTMIKSLVDLDGKLLHQSIELDYETPTIPRVNKFFENKTSDSQEYEGYQGNVVLFSNFMRSSTNLLSSTRVQSRDVRVSHELVTRQLICAEVYRHTALVIWPPWGVLGASAGANRRSASALDKLRASLSSEPTTEEVAIFDYLISSAQHLVKKDLLQVLCGAARRWKTHAYWTKTLEICSGDTSSLLAIDEVAVASSVFGFSTLAASYVLPSC